MADIAKLFATIGATIRATMGLMTAMVRSPRRGWLWFCIFLPLFAGLLFLLAARSSANGPPSLPSAFSPSADQEPITPIPLPPPADPRKVALGERLFEDPRLSHDGTRSCLTCHDTRTNGATDNRFDRAADGSLLSFNTTTIFNAALSFRFNWEGNFRTLQAQAESALESPDGLGATIDEILTRLGNDREMARQFLEIYGHAPDGPSLLDALVTYERSLLTPASRFDRWLDGEKTALSAEEQDGYRLFKTLGCVSCHQGVNVGGNLFQRHGIFAPLASPDPEILRVPSLRNVAVTPPYFHDGSAPSLDEAVRLMGKAQLDRTLSDQQIHAIVAYLRSLTGVYRGKLLSRASP
jgi:cytochrome c peroxidase